MDKSIRKNEICVIGLPRCDFVFSSTRSCFIAYGFDTSTLEMDILKGLLEERGLIAEEAGGSLAPGQSAFCAKICSKIITAQFCIVLLNHDLIKSIETPNANVNMEYGLMLGFNKYVIPFQREDQKLPFNVAGLDTIKYTNKNFRDKAIIALDQAISETAQESLPNDSSDQMLELFLMERGLLVAAIDSEGDRNLYRLGDTLGFNLLVTFSGNDYAYLGRFASLRPESVLWRLRKLNSVVSGRQSSLPDRLEQGIITAEQLPHIERMFNSITIIVIVTSESDKAAITEQLTKQSLEYTAEILTISEVEKEIESAIPTNA